MESFFIEYRDPLFSLIILFLTILVVSICSYWFGVFKSRDKDSQINYFLNQFNNYSDEEFSLLLKEIQNDKLLISFAKCFFKNGEHDRAIDIYLHILTISNDRYKRLKTLNLLGGVYLKVGFLQKAKDIHLNILKNYPRDVNSLKMLIIIYEKMQDYKKAYEVLEPLEELGIDISKERANIKSKVILSDNSIKDKALKLFEIHKSIARIDRILLEYLIAHNIDFFYNNIDEFDIKNSIDLFWYLDNSKINLAIIKRHKLLCEVFSARGFNLIDKSDVFELSILIDLNSFNGNKERANLSFRYECSNCFETFPFYLQRCPNCLNLFEFDLKLSLIKEL